MSVLVTVAALLRLMRRMLGNEYQTDCQPSIGVHWMVAHWATLGVAPVSDVKDVHVFLLRRSLRRWHVKAHFSSLGTFHRLIVEYGRQTYNDLGIVHLGRTLNLLRRAA